MKVSPAVGSRIGFAKVTHGQSVKVMGARKGKEEGVPGRTRMREEVVVVEEEERLALATGVGKGGHGDAVCNGICYQCSPFAALTHG